MSIISRWIYSRSNDLFGGSQAPLMLYGFDQPYGGTLRFTGYDIKESSRSIEVTGAPLIGVINERHLSRRRIHQRRS